MAGAARPPLRRLADAYTPGTRSDVTRALRKAQDAGATWDRIARSLRRPDQGGASQLDAQDFDLTRDCS